MTTPSWANDAEEFLKIKHQFMLGDLSTEKQNPKTIGLAEHAVDQLDLAVAEFHQVDREAIVQLKNKLPMLKPLAEAIVDTVNNGNRIFYVGCGATGRLSLSIEYLARVSGLFQNDQVMGLMAGGDLALIHSIERFEDYPEYAVKQLNDLHFGKDDLLIAVTEGGETPFVIGAAVHASTYSSRPPYFLYCNPDNILRKVAKRSQEVLDNSRIQKINLDVGPMALSGSTRLQATTVQMSACALSLLHAHEVEKWPSMIDQLLEGLDKLNHFSFSSLIEEEAQLYEQKGGVLYQVDPFLAIAVMTDTTERAPTFSLASFENRLEPERDCSWCYLYDENASTSQQAWEKLLLRTPHTLEWPDLNGIAGMKRLLGFDFSQSLKDYRTKRMNATQHIFRISLDREKILLQLNSENAQIPVAGLSLWQSHILLKLALNTHSTLVMGRLKRYQSNIMTYVKASNNKLIDRATRYILALLKEKGKSADYDLIVRKIFEAKFHAKADEPIVLTVLRKFL